MERRPRVAITMGDAAGIGPEITVKSLADPRAAQWCIPLVLGDGRVLESGTHDELLRAGGVYARMVGTGKAAESRVPVTAGGVA